MQDQRDEEDAIELYKQAIQASSIKKATTQQGDCLRKFLRKKETHINTFGKLLVGMTEPFTQPGTSEIG